MIIDSARLNGPCSCGREHVMVTKEAVIEAGCMEKLDFYAAKYGLTGRRAVVYDENTYRAKNLVRPRADQEIVLNPENLHANEIAVSMLREKLQLADGGIFFQTGARTDSHLPIQLPQEGGWEPISDGNDGGGRFGVRRGFPARFSRAFRMDGLERTINKSSTGHEFATVWLAKIILV